jgi:hypothetical protein
VAKQIDLHHADQLWWPERVGDAAFVGVYALARVILLDHVPAAAVGYYDNGSPGERGYHSGYYGAFVFDPDGNNVEAVHHNR